MANDRLELRVANLDCESDAAKIKRGFADVGGVVDVEVMPKSAKVVIDFDPHATSPDAIRGHLQTLGFPAATARELPAQPAPWRNPKVVTSVLSGIVLLIGWLIAHAGLPELPVRVLYIASAALGAYYFGREAIEELLLERQIGIELLMLTGTVVAIVMGQPAEGAMLAFLYSMSEAAEGYTEQKTRGAIKALMELAPKMATVRRDGREVEIPAEEIALGDVFIVKPGEAIATDGEVVLGRSAINQAPVTGESVPVEKNVGDTVFAGSINEEGSLDVRATTTFANNTLARIITMVEQAQEQKGKSHRFIERFGHVYSPIVLLAGIMVALAMPLLAGGDWRMWIMRATVFIVAAAPCALVISIPITLVAALGTGARNGVLIKGGVYIEELAKIRVVALDKTGTITRGTPEVTDVLAFAGHDDATLVSIAAAVERRSQHPLARAIVRHAEASGATPREATEFRSLTGAAAIAEVNGRTVHIGSPAFFEKKLRRVTFDPHRQTMSRLQAEGKTVVAIGDEATLWGLLAIRDGVRSNARTAIEALHRLGVKVAMLTGDNERTAQAIAREAGIDEVYANLTPEQKAVKVRELAATSGHVAMVGDGVNDAPALAAATVGIAMGAAGTDVALETADVALMADDLEKLVYAIELAKRNQAIVRQNLALSAVVIGVLVIGAIAGKFTLPIAVIGHELSEFVVIASGLRMLRS